MGYIKLSDEIVVTCTSIDAVSLTLMVEVNGEVVSDLFKDSIATSLPGKFVFSANSFNKD